MFQENKVLVLAVATVITALLTPLYNWLLIYYLGQRLDGAAYAAILENCTDAVLLSVYFIWREVRLRKDSKHTLGKWCALEPPVSTTVRLLLTFKRKYITLH